MELRQLLHSPCLNGQSQHCQSSSSTSLAAWRIRHQGSLPLGWPRPFGGIDLQAGHCFARLTVFNPSSNARAAHHKGASSGSRSRHMGARIPEHGDANGPPHFLRVESTSRRGCHHVVDTHSRTVEAVGGSFDSFCRPSTRAGLSISYRRWPPKGVFIVVCARPAHSSFPVDRRQRRWRVASGLRHVRELILRRHHRPVTEEFHERAMSARSSRGRKPATRRLARS